MMRGMMNDSSRRNFLTGAGAALTTSIFTGNVKGANDRVSAAFIGVGRMGQGNLGYAMKQPGLAGGRDLRRLSAEPGDAPWPLARKGGHQPREVKDFREILADKSIDIVNISTPDHWHAYMTVEACKAGKDVYVEKPVCVAVEEGEKMVQAARKYNRVVQAGTMQRSALHFQKACEMVRSGELGKVTFVRTWNYGSMPEEGIGNPPDERAARRPGLGHVAGARAQTAVQQESLRRRTERASPTSAGSGTTPAA